MKAIDIAKSISKKPEADYSDDLHEINLHKIFEPILKLKHKAKTCNLIVGYIIFAYSKDSTWLDIRKDRLENKLSIFRSLEIDKSSDPFREILHNQNEIVNDVLSEYLAEQTDWRWQSILTHLAYHENMLRFINQKTATEKSYDKVDKEGNVNNLSEEYDIDTIVKVNKQKGELLLLASNARREADKLISEIKKDFVGLDNAVQQDFGFEMTDEKKMDIMSWRSFVKNVVIPQKEAKKNAS